MELRGGGGGGADSVPRPERVFEIPVWIGLSDYQV